MREFAVSFCPQTTEELVIDEFKEAALVVVGGLLVAALVAAPVIYVQASNEAAAFNRLTTGPKVTTWDAVWLDLRVEAR